MHVPYDLPVLVLVSTREKQLLCIHKETYMRTFTIPPFPYL